MAATAAKTAKTRAAILAPVQYGSCWFGPGVTYRVREPNPPVSDQPEPTWLYFPLANYYYFGFSAFPVFFNMLLRPFVATVVALEHVLEFFDVSERWCPFLDE